ncbi:MAG: alpha/beta fold hydrolase [Nitrososphaeria archaeon]
MKISVENVTFQSNGNVIQGRIYRPEKLDKKAPGVIMCHGFPGHTKSTDLAEELALNGYIAFIFFYQGAWGSGGKYSLTKLEVNTHDAIEYLLSTPSVDPDRLAMIGHSMGAVPVSKTISLDKRIKTVVLLSPGANFRKFTSSSSRIKNVNHLFLMGKGLLSGLNIKDLQLDLNWVYKNSNPLDSIKKSSVPVLVIVGSKDTLTPPSSCRRLYNAANEPKEFKVIEGADHYFSRHRYLVIDYTIEWLGKHL